MFLLLLATSVSYALPPANPADVAKVMTFVSRPTSDNQSTIMQSGNDNTITVEQIGTKNNYTNYTGVGSSNSVTINQIGTNDLQTNFVDLSTTGNTNTIDLEQTTTTATSFGKGIFATVADDNNLLSIHQTDEGNHYATVNLSGGNKNVSIIQEGAAPHMSEVILSGQPASLNLRQSGATQQIYSINSNCATAGGCAPISVQQGQ
jgi:hypothetical protein